jgi:hypothetical protein
MKKQIIALIVVALALATTHVATLDGLLGLLGSISLQEDTVYAPGYSDRAFRSVQAGRTRGEVRERLGEPLEVRVDPWATRKGAAQECWAFSRSPGDTEYRIRLVCFSTDGVVLWKESLFWFD